MSSLIAPPVAQSTCSRTFPLVCHHDKAKRFPALTVCRREDYSRERRRLSSSSWRPNLNGRMAFLSRPASAVTTPHERLRFSQESLLPTTLDPSRYSQPVAPWPSLHRAEQRNRDLFMFSRTQNIPERNARNVHSRLERYSSATRNAGSYKR